MKPVFTILLTLFCSAVFAQDDIQISPKLAAINKIKEIDEYVVRNKNGYDIDSILLSKTYFDRHGNKVKYIKGQFDPSPKYSQWSFVDSIVYNAKGQAIKELEYTNGSISYKQTNKYNSKGKLATSVGYYLRDSVKNVTVYLYNKQGLLAEEVLYVEKHAVDDKYNAAKEKSLGQPVMLHQYQYDAKGRQISYTMVETDNMPTAGMKVTYSYIENGTGTTRVASYYNTRDSLLRQEKADYDAHNNELKTYDAHPDKNTLYSHRKYNSMDELTEVEYLWAVPPGQSSTDGGQPEGSSTPNAFNHNHIINLYNPQGIITAQLHYSGEKLVIKLRWHYTQYK